VRSIVLTGVLVVLGGLLMFLFHLHAGLRAAQALLGHSSVDTTASTYVDQPGLEEISISVHGFSYRGATGGYRTQEPPAIPLEATTGIEPV
jgi:hypothetical protein